MILTHQLCTKLAFIGGTSEWVGPRNKNLWKHRAGFCYRADALPVCTQRQCQSTQVKLKHAASNEGNSRTSCPCLTDSRRKGCILYASPLSLLLPTDTH